VMAPDVTERSTFSAVFRESLVWGPSAFIDTEKTSEHSEYRSFS